MTIIYQAAAIPYQLRKQELYILIIRSRSGKKWIIPKGIIENGDSAKYTAEKETEEEAGVRGHLKSEICGQYEYKKWGSICKVQVFTLKVNEILEEWDEMEFRDRKWEKAETAIKKVKPKRLKKIIKKFIESVN